MTLEVDGAPSPRHARVLPSFAVAFVVRPLDCSLGSIEGRELLAWRRPGLPNSKTASHLRAQFVRRKRETFDAIWDSSVNVSIVEEWRRALTDEERLRLLPLVRDEAGVQAFPQLTLRTVKTHLRMPVADVLGVLAKLEALYWVPAPQRGSSSSGAQMHTLIPVDPALQERMQACLASAWVNELHPHDLRFPRLDDQTLSDWLGAHLERNEMPAAAHDVCQRLLAADRASWAQELADITSWAMEHASPRPGKEETKKRWTEIFLARHGGLSGLELQKVGEQFGLTRERVRQICDGVLVGLRSHPVQMPALGRLLNAASSVMPLSMEDANVQLAPFLGEGYGLRAAMNFADLMDLKSPVRETALRARTHDGYKPVTLVEAYDAPASWAKDALAHARRDCTFVGCTNYLRIAGLLALEQGIAPDLETLQTVFGNAPGFRVLDTDSGWFTLADSESSATASRMRKIMAVADGSVDLDTVASALMTDDRWLHREDGRTLALPPLHVLAELFSGWDWLKANGHNKYTARTTIDPNEVLSRTEVGAVEVIEKHGGAATRAELAEHLIGNLGVTNVAVSQIAAMSAAVCKLDHSIYGVRGRPLPAEALVEARKRRTAEQYARSPYAEMVMQEIDLSAPIRTTVTQSASTVSPNLRVVYLPSYLSGKITGVFEHKDGVLPQITIGSANQIRQLAKAALSLGIGPGERFDIIFDVPGKTYSIPDSEDKSATISA